MQNKPEHVSEILRRIFDGWERQVEREEAKAKEAPVGEEKDRAAMVARGES